MKLPRAFLLLALLVPVDPSFAQTNASKDSSGQDAAAAPASVPNITEVAPFPDSYVEYFSRYLEDQRRGFIPGKDGKPRRLEPDYLVQSIIAHKLWKKTGNQAFKTEALDDFSKALSDPKFSIVSFGKLRGFGQLAAALKEEGLLTTEQ
jgi:hypothetical protein